jgi:outer membrane protein OmpA-like peptidoglycan-associated protein
VLAKLKKLRKKKNKVVNTLHNVDVEIQNLNHDPITNQQKKIIALNKQKKNQNKLQEIEEDIIDAEKKRNEKELTYIAEAREIFEQCEQLEKQRLNEIRQVLIDFNRAVHSSKYSKQLDSIYEQLISNIITKQNSTADVEYWAQAYGVNNVTITVSSETDEEENDYDSDSVIYYNID